MSAASEGRLRIMEGGSATQWMEAGELAMVLASTKLRGDGNLRMK